jgi:acyl-coenzyme A thioesterase PaaI-like protein
MRSLNECLENVSFENSTDERSRSKEWYEQNLTLLKQEYHSRCLFNKKAPIEDFTCSFTDNGRLIAILSFDDQHEGYDGMTHGGIVAAVIDSLMAQCLMGHGAAAYTADLRIRYFLPVLLCTPVKIRIVVTNVDLEKVYHLEAQVFQKSKECVTARGKFFRIN